MDSESLQVTKNLLGELGYRDSGMFIGIEGATIRQIAQARSNAESKAREVGEDIRLIEYKDGYLIYTRPVRR